MKKTVYLIAKSLYYTSSVFLVFVTLFSILAFAEHYFGWNLPLVELKENNTSAFIRLPLVELGISFPLKIWVVLVMCIGILFYVVFFFTLKEFFHVFLEDKSFCSKSLNRLKIFLYVNLIPFAYGIVLSVYTTIRYGNFKFEEDQGFALVHLFIAFLVYLFMDLLKKGNVIQQENDLTI